MKLGYSLDGVMMFKWRYCLLGGRQGNVELPKSNEIQCVDLSGQLCIEVGFSHAGPDVSS
jgi:hypothetical protein